MAYGRVAVARSSGGFTINGNATVATLTADAAFATSTGGGAGGKITHFGLGTASSGAGHLLFWGTVSPQVTISSSSNGVAPTLLAASTIAVNCPEGTSDAAGSNILKLFLLNTTMANVGDSTGIVGSGSAGSLYLSLHTDSPEAGDQTTNEISYS